MSATVAQTTNFTKPQICYSQPLYKHNYFYLSDLAFPDKNGCTLAIPGCPSS